MTTATYFDYAKQEFEAIRVQLESIQRRAVNSKVTMNLLMEIAILLDRLDTLDIGECRSDLVSQGYSHDEAAKMVSPFYTVSLLGLKVSRQLRGAEA